MPKISLKKASKFKPNNSIKKKPDEDDPDFEFSEPPGGLVPLSDTGFWTTPGEPADPQDCERWENSPFCSNDFFTLTPFDFEPSIVLDGCNIGIRLDFSFGFYRMPPVAIVYRNPSEDCKVKIPVTPPSYEHGSYTPYPNNTCDENSQSLSVYWVKYRKFVIDYIVPDNVSFPTDTPGHYYYESEARISIDSIEYSYTGTETPILNSRGIYWNPKTDFVRARIHFTTTFSYTMSQLYNDKFAGGDGVFSNTLTNNFIQYVDSNDYILNMMGTGEGEFSNKAFAMLASTLQAKQYLDTHPLVSGKTTFNTPEIHALQNQNIYATEPLYGEHLPYYYARTHIVNWDIKVVCGVESPKKNPPPPEDYPPPRHCCMSCCPSQIYQDNSLLNLLIQKVDKLSKVVGVDDYPVSLPTSLISKDEGFLGNLIPNFNQDVPSLTRFLSWYVERFDEIMGQWEIPIEIKDSDPSKPGDQPVGIKLPNMAEAIAEMFTLCFQTNINSETLLNIAIRNLAETGADKQQNFISYKLLQSLTDYMGFKQKDIKLKMPLLFTLEKTRYDEILKESEVDVAVVEFDEKFGLEADLMRFREGVSILQANYKKKIDPKGDIKAQILKYLLDTYGASNKVNKNDTEDAEFDAFLKEVETGFINSNGVTNKTDPYGKPFNQRPRIKDLTNLNKPDENT